MDNMDSLLCTLTALSTLSGLRKKNKKVPTEEYKKELIEKYASGTTHTNTENRSFIIVMDPDIDNDHGWNSKDEEYIKIAIRYLDTEYVDFDIEKLNKGTVCRCREKTGKFQTYTKEQFNTLLNNGCVNSVKRNLACDYIKFFI